MRNLASASHICIDLITDLVACTATGNAISQERATAKLTEPQKYESFQLIPCEDTGTDKHGYSNMASRINDSYQYQCSRTMGTKVVQSAWNAELAEIDSLLANLKEQVNSTLVQPIKDSIGRFPEAEGVSGPAVAPAVRDPTVAPAPDLSSSAPTSAEAFAPSASTSARPQPSSQALDTQAPRGQWIYTCASGREGPFPTQQMRLWYEQGFFPPTLYVASVDVDTYDSAAFNESGMMQIAVLWPHDTAGNAFRSDPQLYEMLDEEAQRAGEMDD